MMIILCLSSKKKYINNPAIKDAYYKYKNTKKTIEILLSENDVIHIRAQSDIDKLLTNYDGSHCTHYYKLTGFIITTTTPINIQK